MKIWDNKFLLVRIKMDLSVNRDSASLRSHKALDDLYVEWTAASDKDSGPNYIRLISGRESEVDNWQGSSKQCASDECLARRSIMFAQLVERDCVKVAAR